MTMTTDTAPTTFFEPKTLNELGIMGKILTPAIRYECTKLPRQGLDRYLSHLPMFSKKPINMDIDVGCALFNHQGMLIDSSYYGRIRTEDGSVRHGGDGLMGACDFEDKFINQEEINIHLDKLSDDIHHIIIVIANHHKQPLSLANKGVGILRDNEGVLVHEFELPSLDKSTHAIIAWHLQRKDGDWQIQVPLKSINHDDISILLQQAHESLINPS